MKKQGKFNNFNTSRFLFAGVDFLEVSCSENGELELANLGPVTSLAELGCDKQYRWMVIIVMMMEMMTIVRMVMTKRMENLAWLTWGL